MRIVFDENMPRAVVRALRCLVEAEYAGAPEAIEVLHALDLCPQGTHDVPLIQRGAEGAVGKAALVTADRKMRSRKHEREAYRQSGVIGIALASQWNHLSMWARAQLVLAWFPAWVEAIAAADPGTMLDCPYAQKPRRMKAAA